MKRALIIGIDNYPDFPLNGCVNDAQRLSEVLSKHHNRKRNFDCETLTSPSDEITRPILRQKISDLFKSPADIAYLHFSGHGTINGFGGYLVAADYCEHDVGIPMAEILTLANQSPIQNIFITLDCCHSGAFGNLPVVDAGKIILSEGISVITATRSNQEAIEEGGSGIFSSLLIEALEGGAAGLLGEVTAANIFAYIDNALGAWDQRPLFKANVSKFIKLREALPKIDIKLLEKIKEYFPLPAEALPLSPAYEPSARPKDIQKEAIMSGLQKLRNVGLVEPIGAEHMYHAAIESKECGLTSLGKYYWRLVNENKI